MNDTTPNPPDSIPKYIADGLPKQDTDTLHDIQNHIGDMIEYRNKMVTNQDLPDTAEPIDEDLDDNGRGTVVKERVKCAADCTCNDGTGHGPYLYRYYYEDGKLKSEYIGKTS